MKKSMLILAAVVISLIGVNAQQNFSEKKGKVVIQEKLTKNYTLQLLKILKIGIKNRQKKKCWQTMKILISIATYTKVLN